MPLDSISHLKYDDPCITYVVKIDRSFMWVGVSCVTAGIILVPVHTEPHGGGTAIDKRLRAQAQGLTVQCILFIKTALPSAFSPSGHVTAGHDAVILSQRADEGPLVILLRLIIWGGEGDARCAEDKTKGEVKDFENSVLKKNSPSINPSIISASCQISTISTYIFSREMYILFSKYILYIRHIHSIYLYYIYISHTHPEFSNFFYWQFFF